MKLTSRSLAVLAATGLTAVSVAGCGNGLSTTASHTTGSKSAGTTTTVSPSPSSSPSRSSSPSSSPKSSSTSTTAPTGSSTACTVQQLAVGKQTADGGAAAGSDYLLLTFRNTSATSCTLEGHPGVSFVGKNRGTQIGRPATRNGSLRLVRLSPGETTTALLQIADAGDYSTSTCAPTTSDGFRVYPPGSYTSVFVAFPTQACQGDLTSTGSPQLSVSAVGSSG